MHSNFFHCFSEGNSPLSWPVVIWEWGDSFMQSIKDYSNGEVIKLQSFGLYYSSMGPFNLRS